MTNPEQKIAETQSKVRVSIPIVLYEQEATLGLILRPVKRIIDKDKAQADAEAIINASAGVSGAASAAPATGTSQETPPAPGVITRDTQKAVEKATSSTFENLRAILVSQASIENKDNNSQDEYGPLIKMPLPEKIKDSLRLNYSTAELGFAAAGAFFGESVAKAFSGGPGVADALAGNAAYGIRTLLSGLGSSVGGLTQKLAGNIPNPFSATIFEKVTPRKFNFSWTIQPQSQKESTNLRDVINHLRYWSLPNPSADRLMLDVPYEWELSFVGSNFLYAFSRCVMSNLDIDYSPNGFNSFMSLGSDTAPQSVTITIDFEEIFPLDKSNFDQGNVPDSMKPTGVLSPRAQNTGLEEAKKREEGAAQRNVVAAADTKLQEARQAEVAARASYNNAWKDPESGKVPTPEEAKAQGIPGVGGTSETLAKRISYFALVDAKENIKTAEKDLNVAATKYTQITGQAIDPNP